MDKRATSSHDSEGFLAHLYLSSGSSTPPRQTHWEAAYHSPKLARVLKKKKTGWKTAKTRRVLQTPILQKRPVQLAFDFSLEGKFRALAEQWIDETEHISNLNKAIAHPAYQQIIGMGKVLPSLIVPLLLQELERTPDHWLVALHEITKEDPAPDGANFEEAVQAWLNWGRNRGYLI